MELGQPRTSRDALKAIFPRDHRAHDDIRDD